MTYEILVVNCGGPGVRIPHWPTIRALDNTDNKLSPCQAYQQLLESSKSEVLVYAHDDLIIREEGWLKRLLALFETSLVVAAGFGGALGLGSPHLYKRAYRIEDMARQNYYSNSTEWSIHGLHEAGERRVAVLDAFLIAVRRDFLLEIGGWPVKRITHHAMDLWLACEAARHEKLTYITGVCHTHLGGGSSTKSSYRTAKWLQGHSLEEDHRRPHQFLYQEYRDVLPIQVSK